MYWDRGIHHHKLASRSQTTLPPHNHTQPHSSQPRKPNHPIQSSSRCTSWTKHILRCFSSPSHPQTTQTFRNRATHEQRTTTTNHQPHPSTFLHRNSARVSVIHPHFQPASLRPRNPRRSPTRQVTIPRISNIPQRRSLFFAVVDSHITCLLSNTYRARLAPRLTSRSGESKALSRNNPQRPHRTLFPCL
ncbi:uncharacterized protein BDZ83DRAFT_136128 [Colletotrichum acutatum]|uniref:Uncharacterized protein n=1 Tax=Glomerella acutata TaxID=27357 RepID=A0AAD8UBP8_GLOAC|nr:uncharacterized protein BDZ83DRAFT_136128 [Colletotrichum acutatum]KAK1709730.1 hypothetical protein BDZ83DRAFT_136128 [Colletotrichum acutatum]